MVEFRAVTHLYASRGQPVIRALADVSFQVAPGELVVVQGGTGAGKSTLLRLAWGAERPSQGQVLVDGRDVGRLGGRALARLRRRLGVVPQEPPLVGDRTVLGNLRLALAARGLPGREVRLRAQAALRLAGLAGRARAHPPELAAGERQRLALACALAAAPALVLADEPVVGLAEAEAREVVALLRAAHSAGATVLVATRAAWLAAALGARPLVLEAGRVRPIGAGDGAA